MREQPHLREAVERRCVAHKLSMQAALEIDFVARNAGPSNFTKEVRARKGSPTNPGLALRSLTGPAFPGLALCSDWSSVLEPSCSWTGL